MKFSVGQVIYLLSTKDIKVYPAQVVEEINRKTLRESVTSYVIKLPDKDGTEVILEQISAEIFTSINDLEQKMIENAKNKIKLFLVNAKKLEETFLDKPIIDNSESEIADIQDTKSENNIEVDLGDGKKGRIDISQIG